MTLENVIERLLIENPVLRNNDLMLIARVIKEYYGLTDTYDIALKLKGNVYETIRRSRAKIQETNPYLKADETTLKARAKKEIRIREEMRGF